MLIYARSLHTRTELIVASCNNSTSASSTIQQGIRSHRATHPHLSTNLTAAEAGKRCSLSEKSFGGAARVVGHGWLRKWWQQVKWQKRKVAFSACCVRMKNKRYGGGDT